MLRSQVRAMRAKQVTREATGEQPATPTANLSNSKPPTNSPNFRSSYLKPTESSQQRTRPATPDQTRPPTAAQYPQPIAPRSSGEHSQPTAPEERIRSRAPQRGRPAAAEQSVAEVDSDYEMSRTNSDECHAGASTDRGARGGEAAWRASLRSPVSASPPTERTRASTVERTRPSTAAGVRLGAGQSRAKTPQCTRPAPKQPIGEPPGGQRIGGQRPGGGGEHTPDEGGGHTLGGGQASRSASSPSQMTKRWELQLSGSGTCTVGALQEAIAKRCDVPVSAVNVARSDGRIPNTIAATVELRDVPRPACWQAEGLRGGLLAGCHVLSSTELRPSRKGHWNPVLRKHVDTVLEWAQSIVDESRLKLGCGIDSETMQIPACSQERPGEAPKCLLVEHSPKPNAIAPADDDAGMPIVSCAAPVAALGSAPLLTPRPPRVASASSQSRSHTEPRRSAFANAADRAPSAPCAPNQSHQQVSPRKRAVHQQISPYNKSIGGASSAVPTIAIVDDDSVQLSIYKKQFAKMGANVVTFSSGQDFVSQSSSASKFDLIVMDYVMPGMNGVETISSCGSLLENTTVCVLSGNSLEQKDETFLDSRGDCSLTRCA